MGQYHTQSIGIYQGNIMMSCALAMLVQGTTSYNSRVILYLPLCTRQFETQVAILIRSIWWVFYHYKSVHVTLCTVFPIANAVLKKTQ